MKQLSKYENAIADMPTMDFKLPKHLQQGLPTELRGIARDEVRLMVSNLDNNAISHAKFRNLSQYLLPGDALVVNTSGTLKAALNATTKQGELLKLHLSTRMAKNRWLVELRKEQGDHTQRWNGGSAGDILQLEQGGKIQLLKPYYKGLKKAVHLQLWIADFYIEQSIESYLEVYGQPIRYQQIGANYPADWYQTPFAREMGSAEMPSAGRAFSQRLIADLEAKGVLIIPLLLHTGVASVEVDERPYEEYYRLSAKSADQINGVRQNGGRVIAVGTTVVRTLETLVDEKRQVKAGAGLTDLFISPEQGLWAVDGLITGFHEPRASHLLMLEALAGKAHLELSYAAALAGQYQWHEFGDLHLILPDTPHFNK